MCYIYMLTVFIITHCYVCHMLFHYYPCSLLYTRAVRILQETGNTFTLTVAKHAADFYGISYNIPSTKVSSLERQGDHHGDHQC